VSIVNCLRWTRIAALTVSLVALPTMWSLRPIQFGLAKPPVTSNQSARISSQHSDTRLKFSPAYGERRIYPYSVIPGGVTSVESLRSIVQHNPEIARHLSDFDFQHARVVQVTDPRAVYVSYRIGSHIFWTTKRLTLAKGESLVTDGTRTLRGRCGNDVSDVAVEPTSAKEPPIAQLDTPLSLPRVDAQPDLDPLPLLTYVPPDDSYLGGRGLFFPPVGPGAGSTSMPTTDSPNSPPGAPLPPVIIPPSGPPSSHTTIPSTPPVSTPEPSSLLLMLIGAAGVGAKRLWKKRKWFRSRIG
jgi:hypothetical protein